MGVVMGFVLGAGTGDEVVEGLHLHGHVLHLRVDDADGLGVDGLGGCLDGGVVVVDGGPVSFHFAFQGFARLEDLVDQVGLLFGPDCHCVGVRFVCVLEGGSRGRHIVTDGVDVAG